MKKLVNRREFLKLSALTAVGASLPVNYLPLG